MVPIILFVLILCTNANQGLVIPDHNVKLTFNPSLYEEVLDEHLCHQQIQYLINNNADLLLRFLDAGIRTPRGLLDGNLADLGNYHQCLAINHEAPSTSSTIDGKYCTINLPLSQDIDLQRLPEWPELPDLPWKELNRDTSRLSEDMKHKLVQYEEIKRNVPSDGGGDVKRVISNSSLSDLTLLLAICIPKTCTTEQAISELFFNVTEVGLQYEDRYCRLPNDKQWVAADYVAIVIFSILFILLIFSTVYDVYQTAILDNDSKRLNKIYLSFSVFTNTRELVTYKPVPGAIECLDGIRTFAMTWVILNHSYLNQFLDLLANTGDFIDWMVSPQGLWITMSSITVDTFLLMSGLLVVYTTSGRLTRSRLLKNLHIFYLNRLLRLFPVLAAMILIQASILNRITDGPNWAMMASNTESCRVYWWATLLHVQNWVAPTDSCLGQTWYIAVDVQLHIISPIVLFWVLGNRKRVAWIALAAGLTLSLVGASVYNFIMDLPSTELAITRDLEEYIAKYYVNTLTRSSSFFVGMLYGYILHLNRHKKLQMSTAQVSISWVCAIAILAAITWINYPIIQLDWDNQTVDNLVNSYMRPLWALAVGWIILACHHGYGGPVNWILSLRCFKVPSRLSYAIYIVHYPLIFMVNSARIAPAFFSPTASFFKFLADFTLAAIVAYCLTLLVDSPSSVLVKRFLGGDRRKQQAVPPKELIENN